VVNPTDLAYPDALPATSRLHCYVLEKVLGQGGFAITYLAHDTYLDQAVAIKEYLPVEVAQRDVGGTVRARTIEHRERYQWGLDRFLSEARTLARFDHPNIVRVLSVFEQNGTAYMVMRYENGTNLATLLDRRNTLPESQLLGILLPILDGIELVHDAKFIHRDIKPDNIYVRADDSPVLLDFGAARESLGQPRTMTALVTSGYTPFEQYQSDPCGPWTDIYSLGATCYRAISGISPADALTRVKSSLGSLDDPLVPACVIGKGRYSEPLLIAIDQALKISEKQRPQSVREWRQMMAPSTLVKAQPSPGSKPAQGASTPKVEVDPASARKDESTTPQQKPSQRSSLWVPVLWAAAISVLVSVGVITAWLLLGPQAQPPPAAPIQPAPAATASAAPAPTAPAPAPPTVPAATDHAIAVPDTKPPLATEPPEPRRTLASSDHTAKPHAAPGAQRNATSGAGLEAHPPAPLPATSGGNAGARRAPPPAASQASASLAETSGAMKPAEPTPAPPPARAVPTVESSTAPASPVAPVSVAPVAVAPAAPDTAAAVAPAKAEHPAANAAEPESPSRPRRAAKPAGVPQDDETLAAAGDPDALLRVGELYAAGKSGYPNPFFAYVYFKLALLGGKREAESRLKEQAQKLQPPEIRQADLKVDSLRKIFADAAREGTH